MGSYSGYIGIRTNSKRLYMDICRKTDTDFGSRCGDVWQVTFECRLDEQEMISQINEYIGMAQSDESVIACGYTQYSVVDSGTYYRYLGNELYSWTDIMLSYFSDDDSENESELLWKAAMRKPPVVKKRFAEICSESAAALKELDMDSFSSDGSWWHEKREIEKAKRLENAQALYLDWRNRMSRMLEFVLSNAEKPFGGDRLTRMHVLKWFESDPDGLVPYMRKHDMNWYFVPYIYDHNAKWLILKDGSEILDLAPTKFDELDSREKNLQKLVNDLKRPGHQIHVCTYEDACAAMKLEAQPDDMAIVRADRERLKKTGLAEDTEALCFEGKKIGFLNERYNVLYAVMAAQNGDKHFITNETASFVDAVGVDLNVEYDEDYDLSELDYIVIGPDTDPEDKIFKDAARIRKRKGKPVILLEMDYLMCVERIIEGKEEDAIRLAQEAAEFDASRYDYPGCSNIRKRAKSTVGHPLDLDREKNTCRFISTSTDDEYFTSLSACSCPAYLKSKEQRPCKHMFRLALELGKLK